MKTSIVLVFTRLLVIAGFCWLSLGMSPADPPVPQVTVTGSATIKVVPDEMHWSIQVTINDQTLAKAKARHDESLGAALKYLKSLGVAIKDLQTGGIRFEKRTYIDKEHPVPPYDCSTQVTFTLADFDKYGAISDALAKIDGLEVQSMSYATSKQLETEREARKQAVVNAREKADDLAGAASVKVIRVLRIDEGGGDNPPRPMMTMARSYTADSTPPAVPGQLEVGGNVTVTYEVGP